MMIKSKVDDNLIRGCSAGINPVEFSSDPKDLEKGQTRSTITKCEIYEASIVDMPSNKNTVRLFSSDDETNEVPLIKNNTEMADKKDEKQFTFKSEAEMLTFMKKNFGLEPKAVTPKKESEESFNFKSEEDAGNWFQKFFGLEPKAKKTEEKKEDLNTEKVEETEDSEDKKEIAQLKAQIKTLKGGPGAEDKKANQETDEKKKNLGAQDDSFETYSSAKETWDAVNNLVD